METVEKEFFAALAEESTQGNESFGKMFNEAARDPSVISRNISVCFAQSGFRCKCTFVRMNLNQMTCLGAAEQLGLVGQSCVSRLDAYRARTAHRRRGDPVSNGP